MDGQFQRAGFPDDRILECHGSIHHLQCVRGCTRALWPTDGLQIDVDSETIRARSALPRCPHCGGLSRPNILMFGDYGWLPTRFEEQEPRYARWLAETRTLNVVAIEIGAGLAIPTVRIECEERARTLVRINPREAETSPPGIGLALPALDALTRLDAVLTAR